MKTLVETAREQHTLTHLEVINQIGIDWLNSNKMVFESGVIFINEMLPEDKYPEEFKLLAYDKRFWNWYKNEWYFAQKSWLEKAKTFTNLPQKMAYELYIKHIHFRCVLSMKLNDSFDQFIGLLKPKI
ncbi:MAG TPA: hypothetical protein PLP27_06420 [Crocinitomicaceae bacterium]|nr:hypothetical protein [Crocinitomicaceae bacterium]